MNIQLPTKCKSITANAVEQIVKADRLRMSRPLQNSKPRHASDGLIPPLGAYKLCYGQFVIISVLINIISLQKVRY